MVGRLRAECHRLGLREVALVGTQARFGPIQLRASATMRLRRLSRDAIYKEDLGQVSLPLRKGVDPAAQLVTLLRELVPNEDGPAPEPVLAEPSVISSASSRRPSGG